MAVYVKYRFSKYQQPAALPLIAYLICSPCAPLLPSLLTGLRAIRGFAAITVTDCIERKNRRDR